MGSLGRQETLRTTQRMGCNQSRQVMRAPRDIFQLADTVNTNTDSNRDEVTEQTITDSAWIRSFLQTPKMRDSRERTELLYFLVYTSILAALEETDKERTRVVLEFIRARFFTDSQFYQANIALADIHNVINDIFSFYYEGSQQQSSQVDSIRSKLVLLREDQVIRSSLEPVYGEFLNRKNLHPSMFLEQCILSLL